MIDAKMLLVNNITLLYLESLREDAHTNSADLVRKSINLVKLPEHVVDGDKTRDVLYNLKSTTMWMSDNTPQHKYDKNALLQRIRLNTLDDSNTFAALESAINSNYEQDDLKRVILNYAYDINEEVRKSNLTEYLGAKYRELKFDNGEVDWKTYAQSIKDGVEAYNSTMGETELASVVARVSSADVAKVTSTLQLAKDELSEEGSIKVGFQALARMLGSAQGFRRGEFVLLAALQHNFKTGFCLILMVFACMFNKPYMRNKSKKPLILRISAENEVQTDITWLYKFIKEIKEGVEIHIADIDPSEAAIYVTDQLQSMGYTVDFLRVNPSQFTYRDLELIVTKYEAEGWEIHSIFFDYLNMISKAGCDNTGPTGSVVRDLFRRVRNFTGPKGITFFTPHQISTDAKRLMRGGATDNFILELVGKGYYDSCSTIDQEVDLEIMFHIEQRGMRKYLTIARGKHRKIEITPVEHLYFVLEFQRVGTLIPDLNGKDSSMKHVGGMQMHTGGGNDKPWYE